MAPFQLKMENVIQLHNNCVLGARKLKLLKLISQCQFLKMILLPSLCKLRTCTFVKAVMSCACEHVHPCDPSVREKHFRFKCIAVI